MSRSHAWRRFLAGMANTQGGTVLLGVPRAPLRSRVSPDPDAALDLVFQAALLIDPPLVLPVPRLLRSACRCRSALSLPRCWLFLSPQGLPNVYSLEGRYLGREGTQTNPLSARRLRHL